jgi:NADH-quinone oxidoreductase subunit N
MWTPDVYEGAPTPVTAFFAVAPKIAALALFTRVLFDAFPEISDAWRQIVIFLSIASMVLGAFGAIAQSDIKRLMAYSSIGHVGFALVGLAAGGAEGVSALLIYLTIYLAMNVGAFTVILSMRRKEGMVSGINELAGLSKTRPGMAAALAIFMFSLAGVPPLAGFFGKFYVFLAAIHAGLYTLAVLGVLASVVGAYYYLRIIKIMYFDEPLGEFEAPRGRAMGLVMSATAIFTLLFFLHPAPLMEGAQAAAAVLFAS